MPSSLGVKQRPSHTPDALGSAINTSIEAIEASAQQINDAESEQNVQAWGNAATERNMRAPNTMQSMINSQAELASEVAKPVQYVTGADVIDDDLTTNSPARDQTKQFFKENPEGDNISCNINRQHSLNINTYQVREESFTCAVASSQNKSNNNDAKRGSENNCDMMIQKRDSSPMNSVCEDMMKIQLKPKANVTATPKKSSVKSLVKSGGAVSSASGPSSPKFLVGVTSTDKNDTSTITNDLASKEAALLVQLQNIEEESGLQKAQQLKKVAAYILTEEQEIEHRNGQRKLLRSLMYGTGRRQSLAIKQQVLNRRSTKYRNRYGDTCSPILLQTMQPGQEKQLPQDKEIGSFKPSQMLLQQNDDTHLNFSKDNSPYNRTKESDTVRGETAMLSNGFQSFRNSLSPSHDKKKHLEAIRINKSDRLVFSLNKPEKEEHPQMTDRSHQQDEASSRKQTSDAVQFVSEDEFSNQDIGSISQIKSAMLSSENNPQQKQIVGSQQQNHHIVTTTSGELNLQMHMGGQQIVFSQPMSPHSNGPQTALLMSPTSEPKIIKVPQLSSINNKNHNLQNNQQQKQQVTSGSCFGGKPNRGTDESTAQLLHSEVDCTDNQRLEQHMMSKEMQSSSITQVPYISMIQAISPSKEKSHNKDHLTSILKTPSQPYEQSFIAQSKITEKQETAQKSKQQSQLYNDCHQSSQQQQVLTDFLTSHKQHFYDGSSAHRHLQNQQMIINHQRKTTNGQHNKCDSNHFQRHIGATQSQYSRRRRASKAAEGTPVGGLSGVRNRLLQLMSSANNANDANAKNYATKSVDQKRHTSYRRKQILTQVSQLSINNNDQNAAVMTSNDAKQSTMTNFASSKMQNDNNKTGCFKENPDLSQSFKDKSGAAAVFGEPQNCSCSPVGGGNNNNNEMVISQALGRRDRQTSNMLRSSFQHATRKSSLISSLVKVVGDGTVTQDQKSINNNTKDTNKSQAVAQSRNNKRFQHRTTNLTSSLHEEQIQLQKMLNPWSQVIGGQSKRYFKQKQQKQQQMQNNNHHNTNNINRCSQIGIAPASANGASSTAAPLCGTSGAQKAGLVIKQQSTAQQHHHGHIVSIPPSPMQQNQYQTTSSTGGPQNHQLTLTRQQTNYTQSQNSPMSSGRKAVARALVVNDEISFRVFDNRRPQQRVQTAPQCQSPSSTAQKHGAFYLSSTSHANNESYSRRRKTFLNIRSQPQQNNSNTSNNNDDGGSGTAVSQSHDYGTLGMVEDSQGNLHIVPSTVLQGRLLNGISASRRSQQARQTHVRYQKGSSISIGNPMTLNQNMNQQQPNKTLQTTASDHQRLQQATGGGMKRLQSQVQKRRTKGNNDMLLLSRGEVADAALVEAVTLVGGGATATTDHKHSNKLQQKSGSVNFASTYPSKDVALFFPSRHRRRPQTNEMNSRARNGARGYQSRKHKDQQQLIQYNQFEDQQSPGQQPSQMHKQKQIIMHGQASQDTFIMQQRGGDNVADNKGEQNSKNRNQPQQVVLLEKDDFEDILMSNRGNVNRQQHLMQNQQQNLNPNEKLRVRSHQSQKNSNKSPSTANFNSKPTLKDKDRYIRAKSSAQICHHEVNKAMVQKVRQNQINGKQKDLRLIIVPKRLNTQELVAQSSAFINSTFHRTSNNGVPKDRSQSMIAKVQSATSSISQFAANIKIGQNTSTRNKLDVARQNTVEIIQTDEQALKSQINDDPICKQQKENSNISGELNSKPQKHNKYTIQTSDVSCVTPTPSYLAKAAGLETEQIIQQNQIEEQAGFMSTKHGSAEQDFNKMQPSPSKATQLSVNLQNQLRSSRMAENLLCSIKISSKRRNFQESSYNMPEQVNLVTHQSPLPRKKAMPVSQFTFGDSKMQKMRNSSQVVFDSKNNVGHTTRNIVSTAHAAICISPPGESQSPKPDQKYLTSFSKYPVTKFKTNPTSNQPFFRTTVLPTHINNELKATPQTQYMKTPNLITNSHQIPETSGPTYQPVNIPVVSDFISHSKHHQQANTNNNEGSRMKSGTGINLNNNNLTVNLRTSNVSHPSIQDEKSSIVGAINDLIPKYSNSSVMRQQQATQQQHHPNFVSSGLLWQQDRSKVMTQTLQNHTHKSKRPPMLAQNVQLMKKKHVSTLASPGMPLTIPESQQSPSQHNNNNNGNKVDDDHSLDQHSCKKQTKSPTRTSQLSKEFVCDDKICLFASDAQLNSERSEFITNEITNINLGQGNQ